LLVGPVFSRELVTVPRRARLYAIRAIYVLGLLGLMCTAYLVLTRTQVVRDTGDLARFGMILFQILAPLQMALVMFFSALLAASAVAQEKDRRTLVLLLLTHLSNAELVLGKLLSSLLGVLVLLAAAVPLFMFAALLGGVSFSQIFRVFAVTLAAALACGSLGALLAFWREKTFQTLALTVLVLVIWVAAWEIVAAGALGESWGGISCRSWAAGFSPWQAVRAATHPDLQPDARLGFLGTPVHLFLLVATGGAVLLSGLAVARVRVWNPSREVRRSGPKDPSARRESIWGAEYDGARPEQAAAAVPTAEARRKTPAAATRRVWDNPILWREVRTWAYGRKVLVIRLVYLLMFAVAAIGAHGIAGGGASVSAMRIGGALVPLFFLSLVMVNAQAVTSLTGERDGRALDLLLVTDITPKEFVYGKLLGVFYNTKEMVVLPMLLCVYLWSAGAIGLENVCFLVGGLAVMYAFVAMLGVHAGMTYADSRSAIATSLGTIFFLFLGVAVCMYMMFRFSASPEAQFVPFFAFMVGGGFALYYALGIRNPSPAIGLASFLCPFVTFYGITSFFLGNHGNAFVATVLIYGFAANAMRVPAIDEFDVATGRTTDED